MGIKNRAFFYFAVLLALHLGLRLAGITFDSFWLDEGYQSMVDAFGRSLPDFAALPPTSFLFKLSAPSDISYLLQNFRNIDPLCPPLYALVLNRWLICFGDGDLTVRLLSVVFSLISITTIYWLSYRLFGLRTAIFAALILAISPFDIYYSQEARMYSLAQSMSALATACMLMLFHLKNLRWRIPIFICYIAAAWAAINSHYTTLFLFIFHACYVVLFCIKTKNFKPLLLMTCAWLLLFLSWLPWFDLFRQAAAMRKQSFYVSHVNSFSWLVSAFFIKVPGNWIKFLSGVRVIAYAGLIYVTSFLMLGLAAISALKEKDGLKQLNMLAIWLWAIIPAAVVLMLDILENHRVIEISRYLICTAPAIYILAGLGLNYIYERKKLFMALLAVHCISAVINNVYAHVVYQREPWREMAHVVEEQTAADNLIVVSQPYDIVCLNRYLTHPFKQIGLSPQLGGNYIAKSLANVEQFALITAQEGEAITKLLPGDFVIMKQIDLAHGLHFRLLKKRFN